MPKRRPQEEPVDEVFNREQKIIAGIKIEEQIRDLDVELERRKNKVQQV
jgi:hypothetical protein